MSSTLAPKYEMMQRRVVGRMDQTMAAKLLPVTLDHLMAVVLVAVAVRRVMVQNATAWSNQVMEARLMAPAVVKSAQAVFQEMMVARVVLPTSQLLLVLLVHLSLQRTDRKNPPPMAALA